MPRLTRNSTKIWSTRVHSLLSGEALFSSHGFPVSELNCKSLRTRSAIGHLTGNAMCLTVVGACMLGLLVTTDAVVELRLSSVRHAAPTELINRSHLICIHYCTAPVFTPCVWCVDFKSRFGLTHSTVARMRQCDSDSESESVRSDSSGSDSDGSSTSLSLSSSSALSSSLSSSSDCSVSN